MVIYKIPEDGETPMSRVQEDPEVIALVALNILQTQDDRPYTAKQIAEATKSVRKYGHPLKPEDVPRALELYTNDYFFEKIETPSGLTFKLRNLL
jgi:hypothetical protein